MIPPDTLIIIPARYASQRFPGKPLVPLRGADGTEKPLIQRSWEAARRIAEPSQIYVATDDQRIADVVASFGGQAVMTSPDARNGTERCAELLAQLSQAPRLVINLQGDSPLVPPDHVTALLERQQRSGADMVTPYITCDADLEARLLEEAAAGRVGGTTVVADQNDHALYFSKRPLPHRAGSTPNMRLHLGVYLYTPAALARYAATSPTPLELAEGLEQLRFLEHGAPIHLAEVQPVEGGMWEVNNPEDVPIVEAALVARGIA